MIKIAFACIAAALIDSAQALYVKGKCPNVTSIPYRSEIATPIWYRFSYIDQHTFTLFNTVAKAANLNTTCMNDGKHGYSESEYAYWFQNSTSITSLNYLFYDATTATSLVYTCIDQKRFK